jgi:NAD(P)H-hydrate epimerase
MSSAAMRALDRFAIDVEGVPSTLLMTNAARHVADAALELLDDNRHAVIFCGTGNNGGDGVAAAAFLIKRGIKVRAFLVGDRAKMTPDTLEMARRLGELGGSLEDFSEAADLELYSNHCGVIIDALFGIGLNSDLRGDALEAVRLINASPAPVVAADIPSGVEADTGRVLGDAVRADITVTFTYGKPGQFVEPGCVCCGEVRIADIGIPRALADDVETDVYAVVPGDISLPRRRPDTHKGDYGRDLILAGSIGYSGAPVLAAQAASAAGAGLVSLGVPESIYTIAAVKCDVEMVFPLPASPEGKLSDAALEHIRTRLRQTDVCLAGPGLGRSPAVDGIIHTLLRQSAVPLVLDADGINALSGNIDILDEARCPVVLTPHPGEFQRLTETFKASGSRIGAARAFAVRHGCILVLKGHRTITALPDGTAYINTTGGPALAKGGSGDVLAGMITALIGQKFPMKDAVLAAVFLHGLAGDLCGEAFGDYAVTAGHVISMLPAAFKTVTGP